MTFQIKNPETWSHPNPDPGSVLRINKHLICITMFQFPPKRWFLHIRLPWVSRIAAFPWSCSGKFQSSSAVLGDQQAAHRSDGGISENRTQTAWLCSWSCSAHNAWQQNLGEARTLTRGCRIIKKESGFVQSCFPVLPARAQEWKHCRFYHAFRGSILEDKWTFGWSLTCLQ